jgi:DNA-binding transcriptional LysR family regulator
VAVEADSINLQFEVAAAGGGYAIAAVDATPDPRLASARIVDPELLRFIVLAESARRPQTRATREVRRLIRELAATMPDH